MGVFCIALGTILAVACVVGGGFLGYLTSTMVLMGQPLYQFLSLPSATMGWVASIGLGVVLAAILGLPLICGGNMYCKGVKMLRKARKHAKG